MILNASWSFASRRFCDNEEGDEQEDEEEEDDERKGTGDDSEYTTHSESELLNSPTPIRPITTADLCTVCTFNTKGNCHGKKKGHTGCHAGSRVKKRNYTKAATATTSILPVLESTSSEGPNELCRVCSLHLGHSNHGKKAKHPGICFGAKTTKTKSKKSSIVTMKKTKKTENTNKQQADNANNLTLKFKDKLMKINN